MMKAKLIFLLKYYLFWVVISIVAKNHVFYSINGPIRLICPLLTFWHILAGGIRLVYL